MRWITFIFGLGIIRGVIFPDYRFVPNIVIIPFLTPLLFAIISVYLAKKKRLSWFVSSTAGLVSVYLSSFIGIFVYGYSVGWNYVTDDLESQAVFKATMVVQTLTYLVVLGISIIVVKRYNKRMQSDCQKATPFGNL